MQTVEEMLTLFVLPIARTSHQMSRLHFLSTRGVPNSSSEALPCSFKAHPPTPIFSSDPTVPSTFLFSLAKHSSIAESAAWASLHCECAGPHTEQVFTELLVRLRGHHTVVPLPLFNSFAISILPEKKLVFNKTLNDSTWKSSNNLFISHCSPIATRSWLSTRKRNPHLTGVKPKYLNFRATPVILIYD